VKARHYPVFDCAIGDRAIHYTGHVKMMRRPAVHLGRDGQPARDGHGGRGLRLCSTWKLGVKAIAIYRDNCKVAAICRVRRKAVRSSRPSAGAADQAPPLPEDRVEVGRKFRVGDGGYIHVGRTTRPPGDIFVDIARTAPRCPAW
jgi:ribonucleoside-diphosphate reductase alpha chain